MLFVALLILALVLDFAAPPPVHGGAATLEFIARNKGIYLAEQLLWIVPNILPVLVFVALFVALAPLDKSLALLATVVGGLSWALILAVPVTSRGSLVLVYLSDRYTAGSRRRRPAPLRDRRRGHRRREQHPRRRRRPVRTRHPADLRWSC